jgi:hypothetical protein
MWQRIAIISFEMMQEHTKVLSTRHARAGAGGRPAGSVEMTSPPMASDVSYELMVNLVQIHREPIHLYDSRRHWDDGTRGCMVHRLAG